MKNITCIAIDDEPMALLVVEQFCRRKGGMELTTFSEPRVGLEEICRRKPDLVFLDIQMNSLNGLEIADRLPRECCFIFTTAYAEYALDGIEVKTVHGKFGIGRGEDQKDACRQLARHVDAVDAAHLDVEEDEVGARVLHPLQAFYGVGIGSQFDVAAPLAELADNAESYRLVVYGNALHGLSG